MLHLFLFSSRCACSVPRNRDLLNNLTGDWRCPQPPTPNPPHSPTPPFSHLGWGPPRHTTSLGGARWGGGEYLLRKHARPVTPPQPLKVGVTVAPGDGGDVSERAPLSASRSTTKPLHPPNQGKRCNLALDQRPRPKTTVPGQR